MDLTMTEKKNALAELAETLKCHDCHDDDFYPAVEKAQRIVAELAKVQTEPYQDCVQAYYACREIAEEGGAKWRSSKNSASAPRRGL